MKRTYAFAFNKPSYINFKKARKIPRATKFNSNAKRVASVATVKKLINSSTELKSITAQSAGNSVSTTGTIIDLTSGIAQGYNKSQRVGDKLTVKKIKFSWNAVAAQSGLVAGSDAYDMVRLIIFKWKENNGAINPVVANILDSTATDPTLAPYNFDQRKLYAICYDKCMTLYNSTVFDGTNVSTEHGPGSAMTLNNQALYGRRLHSPNVEFVNNSTDGTGKYYALIISNSQFANHPQLSIVYQIDYTDA